jgi:hypothetical protein
VEKKENRGSQERIDEDRLSVFRNLVYNLNVQFTLFSLKYSLLLLPLWAEHTTVGPSIPHGPGNCVCYRFSIASVSTEYCLLPDP